jgi:hypothetical protein
MKEKLLPQIVNINIETSRNNHQLLYILSKVR